MCVLCVYVLYEYVFCACFVRVCVLSAVVCVYCVFHVCVVCVYFVCAL